MIIDLAEADVTNEIEADIAIVGAGIAGLLLATRLRKFGVRVIVLESGGYTQDESTHPLNRVVQLGQEYRGATEGRFRCLGGTSTRWGGALIPFLPDDMLSRPHLDLPAWPLDIAALETYLREVENLFGVDGASYEEEFVKVCRATELIPTNDPDFLPRFAKWPVFKSRNVATLLGDKINVDPELKIFLNSTVTNFHINKNSRKIDYITGKHYSGRNLQVSAKHVVITAGAIESTRLLLLLDSEYEGKVFNKCEVLGRYFYDHISMPLAKIVPISVPTLNRLAGHRFVGSTMRSTRFELSPSAQKLDVVASAFGHISFESQNVSGFDNLRILLRSLQQKGKIDLKLFLPMMRSVPYIAAVGFWRIYHKQLLWPKPATYHLHVVVEQVPQSGNRITLSDDIDFLGKRMAAIDWSASFSERKTFISYVRRFTNYWRRHKLDRIGALDWSFSPDNLSEFDISDGSDVYHPGGSTRMGLDGYAAVVNSDLQTFAVPNLWVASTSVFPHAGSSNPTLMLMAFALRLGDHLQKKI